MDPVATLKALVAVDSTSLGSRSTPATSAPSSRAANRATLEPVDKNAVTGAGAPW